MKLEPYFEVITRQGKLTSVLMLGIKRVEIDNNGLSIGLPSSSFPRIFIYYLNDNVIKLDFENEGLEEANEAYRNIMNVSEENLKYMVDNNMLEQFFKIPKS
jgi:hypothetical protein